MRSKSNFKTFLGKKKTCKCNTSYIGQWFTVLYFDFRITDHIKATNILSTVRKCFENQHIIVSIKLQESFLNYDSIYHVLHASNGNLKFLF